MKKIQILYFLIPSVTLAVFYLFFYRPFDSEYAAAAIEKEEAAKQARIEEMKQEAADRERAIKEALALNAERKAERAKKDAADLARKEARTAAEDALQLAESERTRLRERVASIKEEIADTEVEIDTIKEDKARLTGEAEFLRSFVTEAENNKKDFEKVIQDIRKAEQAHAAALIAAANAEK